jgi:hypothetical protein
VTEERAFDSYVTRSIEEAVDWASRQADVLGDGEVDIRPVSEPWISACEEVDVRELE